MIDRWIDFIEAPAWGLIEGGAFWKSLNEMRTARDRMRREGGE